MNNQDNSLLKQQVHRPLKENVQLLNRTIELKKRALKWINKRGGTQNENIKSE